jgi:hypothetical protein
MHLAQMERTLPISGVLRRLTELCSCPHSTSTAQNNNKDTACTGTRLPNYRKVLTYMDAWFRIIQLLHKT